MYNTSQIRLKYLIEYGPVVSSQIERTSIPYGVPNMASRDVPVANFLYNTPKSAKETKLGLIGGDIVLPLKSVIVKAKILDLASEVVVFQTFRNDSSMYFMLLNYIHILNYLFLQQVQSSVNTYLS